jgi:predicted DNA-binding transcriptional regulator AlpA
MVESNVSDRLLTAKQVASRLQVSLRRVHQLNVPKIRLGSRTVRFREADVQALLESRTTRPR